MSDLQGYLHPLYLQSLQSWGEPLFLPEAQGWLLRRPIPSSALESDYAGPYPFLRCLNPQGLAADLAELPATDLALVIVTDPLMLADRGAPLSERCWSALFPDCCHLFKQHWGIDFSLPLQISSHHRYYARKALRALEIEHLYEPPQALATWSQLYAHLGQRHQIQGLRRFSEAAFALQLQVPGMVAFAAKIQGEIVAMHLWYWESERGLAYSHLAASSEAGYLHSAPYALYLTAIEWFQAHGVSHLDFGGEVSTAIGTSAAQGKSGLGFFKRGWANRERPVWLCGKILNAERYAELSGAAPHRYFPAYRGHD